MSKFEVALVEARKLVEKTLLQYEEEEERIPINDYELHYWQGRKDASRLMLVLFESVDENKRHLDAMINSSNKFRPFSKRVRALIEWEHIIDEEDK